MTQIPPQLISLAASLFGFNQAPAFFARSHQHSRACLYESGKHILKIALCRSSNDRFALSERIRFSRYLSAHGVPCQGFVPSVQNNLVEQVEYEAATYLISAWHKIEGHTLEDLHPSQLRDFYSNWAELLAHAHQLARLYPDPQTLHWHSEWQSSHDSLPDEAVKECFRELRTELDSLQVSAHNFGYIHNDAHPKNILLTDTGMQLIDFDRSCAHFFVQDIANAIYSEFSRINFHSVHQVSPEDMVECFLKPFVRAYLKAYPLPIDDLRYIETFLYYRQILMFGIFYREIEAAAPDYLELFRANILARKPFLEQDLLDLL